jgi:serine protease AprX
MEAKYVWRNLRQRMELHMKYNRFFHFAFITIFLFTVAGSTHPVTKRTKAQPELLQMALSKPYQSVSVIVQKINNSNLAEMEVEKLGGKVTEYLHIINAFQAVMTTESAVKLSKTETVRWVSLDAKVESSNCTQCIDTKNLANEYIDAIRADEVWNSSIFLQGQGVGIAVVDSGINPNGDFYTNMGVNRQIANVRFNTDYNQSTSDGYGHGTHVSNVAAGDGSDSNGKYIGVAPMANIINVKVSNDDGSARASDVILGLQWVLDHKDTYNIRVVNLSFNSTVAESYHTSPLDAAVEILWFNKIVVVVSAGNKADGNLYPPANDPFVITVGATDDKGTTSLNDDIVTSFSAYGTTTDGFVKPDLVAPGKNIIARLVNTNMGMAQAHPANVISNTYFKMSGTSVSTPMVSGAVAILLQAEPDLTPDQVKYRLMATANKTWNGYSNVRAGAGYLDIFSAVKTSTSESANTNTLPSQLLTTGSNPITWGSVGWNSVGWNSVGWNSVGWNSVGWNSVGWNSVGWNSDYWGN